MLTPLMIERLNHQISLEQFSSNIYLQMSAWCDHQGYSGSATFLREHAAEELAHMYKLFDYVCETGALAVVSAIPAPPNNFASLADVFKLTYEHEIKVTASINKLLSCALAEEDFSTFQFLQWFISEQHEEERLFKTILDKITVIGLDGKGIYFLDKEIRKLAGQASAG